MTRASIREYTEEVRGRYLPGEAGNSIRKVSHPRDGNTLVRKIENEGMEICRVSTVTDGLNAAWELGFHESQTVADYPRAQGVALWPIYERLQNVQGFSITEQ